MSLPAKRRSSAGSRRKPTAPSSTQHSHGGLSVRSRYSTTSCMCTESNTVSRSNPATPQRQVKYEACGENHGIRPPTPEQYLTPLQQKEVCIRHLRARLKENVERLQDQDSEIEDLRMRLTQMQEDWVEEECHRIEAQLALKEARKEIQQLQQAVETVQSNLGVNESDQQECKSEALGVCRVRPRFGASRSCGCSPAHTMSRSATFTRLSSETSPGTTDRNGNVPSDRYIPANRGAMTLPRGDGRTHLLLEAARLSEQVPHSTLCSALSSSSTCERLCIGETVLPVSPSCHAVNNCSCGPHAYLPHHHLFLHLPQEEAPPQPTPPTAPTSASEVDKPGFRSQACSPTITWISEGGGGEDLSVITSATCTQGVTLAKPQMFSQSSTATSPAQMSYITEPLPLDNTVEFTSSTTTPTVLTKSQVQQPCPRVSLPLELPPQEAIIVKVSDEDGMGGVCATNEAESASPERSHWSRYFLIDLLAVAVPFVPTLAWFCRGARNEDMPMYNMGSLLRGCCAVALHSLRRVGRGCSPSGTGRATPI
ncbi:syntaphilin-like isoform X1 [Xyrauchen texanus]|uniref:syntaphilin-like isoform X1 n=2 Tax=Xyrauchen texanus TaxID=154827 RepID=UPI002241E951|nr:syntaphilin-like isoform X1 [Xyrauchen texanus]